MVDTQLGTMTFGGQANERESVQMVDLFLSRGLKWLDTALMYTSYKSEVIIGNLSQERKSKIKIATKANPDHSVKGLSFDGVVEQLQQSLTNLKTDSVDLFYLHYPDHNHPIEETLKACDHLHKEGKFKELGVCNYAAWELMEIYHICKENNWVVPTVYQGMYNPVTRMVEAELFPCIRRLGIRFYAYNLLAGGLLTGKHKFQDQPEKETKVGRFFGDARWPSAYRKRFWHKEYFDGVTEIQNALNSCYGDGTVTLIEASTRWMYHHSMLPGEHQDGVILGASSLTQLKNNMEYTDKGPLDPDVVAAFDRSWEGVKGVCPRYNR